MIGIVNYEKGREYRNPETVILNLLLDQKRFLIEGGGYIYASKRIKEGIEYEFIVAEFDEPSERITKENDFAERDADFEDSLFSEESQWQYKLQEFRRLEAILKEEGII
ncbi:hypothetical protein HMPREF0765_3830 [Sphingobacterium spiritivorum ATCC 33300]|uniref:Uncharacterized protein n=1 Tax=Sphingobacterium spiritivorum ATCC 33300 TaxID=525372 RepID=C2G2M4_SPHSI|nr:hypothetical protein [Sphingobacterium spiritivorum]EEI90514.1 hypothetical protein HMPREF0765_3830 [Sphingobacterium spiritivorum ATCC 33300]QQS95441.1 hypothetical protein I6J03_19010 [Sphingobacterium spiritivorum]